MNFLHSHFMVNHSEQTTVALRTLSNKKVIRWRYVVFFCNENVYLIAIYVRKNYSTKNDMKCHIFLWFSNWQKIKCEFMRQAQPEKRRKENIALHCNFFMYEKKLWLQCKTVVVWMNSISFCILRWNKKETEIEAKRERSQRQGERKT